MVNVRHAWIYFAGLGAGIASHAQIWDGGAGTGAYGTANNWNPNVVPGNVTLTFNGLAANNQYNINLGGARTVGGIVFISATGTNPFGFSGGDFSLGSSGITNSDADTQVFNADISLASNQSWNLSGGDLLFNNDVNINGKTLTIQGDNDLTLSGRILGTGALVKQGAGTFSFDFIQGNYLGSLTVQQGAVVVTYTGDLPTLPHQIDLQGGSLRLSPSDDFLGFSGAVSINNGAVLTLQPSDEIQSIISSGGTLTFGPGGGAVNLSSRLATGVSLGNVVVNSSAGTPGTIRYGTIANATGGWDTAGRDLSVANGNLSGTGALRFELSNGAMVDYSQSAFTGSLNFTGVSGGNSGAGSTAATVGRLGLNTQSSFTISGGLTFDNAMQVTAIGGSRTLDANITINSGETAFQGRSGGTEDLIIGATLGGRTLTVKDGAAAAFDIRYRTESSLNTVGGVTVNANTILEAGGTANFRRSAGVISGESVDTITFNGDITGQGTTGKESTISLGIGSGTGGVNFANGAAAAGSDLIVNGSGLGGLRVEGTQARVDNLLTSQRIADLTGSGGVLTIAYSDNLTKNFSLTPGSGSNVRLGFDSENGSTPIYQIGSSANDMANWGGLVVNGGTVRAMANESFLGSASQTTSLDLTGGTLALNGRTLTFEGGANLTGGILDGGSPSGTLVIGGNLVHGTTTLANSPNITMNVGSSASISGSAISGAGIVTKQGSGTVTLQTGLTATRIDINSGTLLVGGDNLIGNSTGIRLGGGTLGINGHSDTVGALTLAANSTIDFGSTGSSSWIFGPSTAQAWTSGSILTIVNWDGQWFGGGSDQLVFGNLGASQVAQIRFLNPGGVQGLFNARILANGEIVPVPEPATIGFGALLLGSLGYRERKRLSGFFAAFRKKSAS